MQDRFKFRVFSTTNKRYTDIGLSTALAANSVSNNQFIIQQCLGICDKNNRLIYEGDLLLDITKEIYETYWYGIGFHLKHINSKTAVVTNLSKLEVIASITDNKLLDLKGNVISTLSTVEETLKLLGI